MVELPRVPSHILPHASAAALNPGDALAKLPPAIAPVVTEMVRRVWLLLCTSRCPLLVYTHAHIVYLFAYLRVLFFYFLQVPERLLGSGAFARVVLCHDRRDPRATYALKVLSKAEMVRLKQVEHVANERKTLSDLSTRHPFLVTLYATHQDDTNLCAVASVHTHKHKHKHKHTNT